MKETIKRTIKHLTRGYKHSGRVERIVIVFLLFMSLGNLLLVCLSPLLLDRAMLEMLPATPLILGFIFFTLYGNYLDSLSEHEKTQMCLDIPEDQWR